MTEEESYIHGLTAQGRHRQQDFRSLATDPVELAQTISAFANTSGGRLLIGVRDDGIIAGIQTDEEVYTVVKAAYKLCFPEADINIRTIRTESGKVVMATIPEAMAKPVCAIGTKGLKTAYMRIKDLDVPASPVIVEAWKQDQREENIMPYTDTESHMMEMMRLNPRQPLQIISKISHVKRFLVIKVIARLIRYNLAGWEYDGNDFLYYLK